MFALRMIGVHWSISAVVPTRDGASFFFVCNRAQPGDYEVCVHQPGSPDAFTLKVLDTGESLQQISSSGVSNCEVKRDIVRTGKRKTFQLTFPPLPAGATRLQLGERDCQPNPDSELQNWCFKDIALRKR